MLTFKQFINEARDPKETLAHLRRLYSHPNTPPHEAEAARKAAERIRQTHNIPNETSHPKKATSKETHIKHYKHNKSGLSAKIYKNEYGEWISSHYNTSLHHASQKHAHDYLTKRGYKPI